MRILFMTNDLGGGGAEKVLVNLANRLAQRGHEVTVRALVNQGVNREFLSKEVKYEYVFDRGFRGINFLHKLPHQWIYQKVCYGQFDVIVPYLHGVLTKIASYAPNSQKKIAWLHGKAFKDGKLFRITKNKNELREYFSQYDRVVCVSEFVKDSLVQLSGITDKVRVIYNTFDVSGIINSSKVKVYHKEDDSNIIRLVTVGKLNTVKGYPRLIRSIKDLIQKDQLNIELTIVGEGKQRKELEEMIHDLQLGSCIRLVGFDINPYKYIVDSDLFVCSSYTEGFSSVVAESLIIGTPVITTDCAGMKEMLGENNEYGLIVENSDEGLYTGLKQLLNDKELLLRYKEKARERAIFFEPEATVGAVEALFKEIIEKDQVSRELS